MLILKSQQFNDNELLDFASSLSLQPGTLQDKLLHWSFGPLMTMKHDVDAKNYLFSDENVPFHWDGAFFKEPRLLLFYCTESEGRGGETLFTDTEKMWKDLSTDEQAVCADVRVKYRTKKVAHYGGEIDVPLVQKHPFTGKTIMRMAERVETELNPVDLEISGAPNADEFYQSMVAKLYDTKYMYEHSWEVGDLLVCDNYTYLHGRRELGKNKKRTFKRIQIL